jgi:hypothetical protein
MAMVSVVSMVSMVSVVLVVPVRAKKTSSRLGVRTLTGTERTSLMSLRARRRPSAVPSVGISRILRGPDAGEALEWFLAAVSGRAHVHLVDKEFFVVTRIVDLLLAEPSCAAGTRLTRPTG